MLLSRKIIREEKNTSPVGPCSVGESAVAEVIDLWPIDTVPRVDVQLIGVYIIIGSKRSIIHCYLPIQWFLQDRFFQCINSTAPGPADQLFLCIGEAETRHLKQERFLLRMQLGLVVGIQPCLSMALENVAFVDGIHKKSIVKSEFVPEEASIHVRSTLSKIKSPLYKSRINLIKSYQIPYIIPLNPIKSYIKNAQM